MTYHVISADGHIDLIWLPPDLFTANASAAMRDRMPYVSDGEKGPQWVSRGGARFGLVNGLPAGVRYKIVCENAAGLYEFPLEQQN